MSPRMKNLIADVLGWIGLLIVVAALGCFVIGLIHLVVFKMLDEPLYYKLFCVALLCAFAAVVVFFLGGSSGLLSQDEAPSKEKLEELEKRIDELDGEGA